MKDETTTGTGAMLDFDHYLMRHGEFWIQDIVEQIEQHNGICHGRILPLEDRWMAAMNAPFVPTAVAA